MKKEEENGIEKIIALWKELKVDRVDFEFSCGGDSMNDTTLVIYGEKNDVIKNDELTSFFEDEVYNKVEFYEASDGHYQGEFGNVEITLSSDGEDFDYIKNSQSEWSEMFSSTFEIKLNDEQAKLVKAKVLNINGEEGSVTINYKEDCILTDREEKLLEEIDDLVSNETMNFSPDEYEGELRDYFTFTTNEDGESLELDGNKLTIHINNESIVFRDE